MSKDCIEELERQCDAQLAELEAISEALGTNEGHSSVDHVVALRQQLAASKKKIMVLLAALEKAIEFVPAGYGIERNCWEAIADAKEEWK